MKSFHKHLMGTSALIGAMDLVDLPAADILGGMGLCSAFDESCFDPQGNGTKGNIKIGTFITTTDTLATVETDGYFDSSFVTTTMNTNDLLVVNASDGIRIYELTVVGTDTALKGVMDDFFLLQGQITDLSTAGQIYMVSPFAGTVFAVYGVLNTAITTDDAVVTIKTAAGTVGTFTVANSGSAPGDVDSLTSGLVNTAVAAGATVEVETDGGSTVAAVEQITVVMRRT